MRTTSRSSARSARRAGPAASPAPRPPGMGPRPGPAASVAPPAPAARPPRRAAAQPPPPPPLRPRAATEPWRMPPVEFGMCIDRWADHGSLQASGCAVREMIGPGWPPCCSRSRLAAQWVAADTWPAAHDYIGQAAGVQKPWGLHKVWPACCTEVSMHHAQNTRVSACHGTLYIRYILLAGPQIKRLECGVALLS